MAGRWLRLWRSCAVDLSVADCYSCLNLLPIVSQVSTLSNREPGEVEKAIYLSEFVEFLSVISDLWNAKWNASVVIRCHKRDG